jgi:hypothetical protein
VTRAPSRVRRVPLHSATVKPDPLPMSPDTASLLRPEDRPLLEALSARSPSGCLPLMLALARHHAARRRPSELGAQFERDGFVRPSPLDLRVAHRLDGLALDAAAEFEAVLLSPLAPLGVCAAVSPSSQNRVVTTTRGTEVVSDPTNVLALECATRLSHAIHSVRLATLHQTVRAQRFKQPGYAQHFRLFVLAEAGAALPDHAFEVEAFVRHVRVFVRLLDACEAEGSRFPNRVITLLVGERGQAIGARLRARLVTDAPGVRLEEGPLDSNYYDGVRVLLDADDASGGRANIADTGLFDWVAKLTSNKRFRFVASGLGLQLLATRFGAWEPGGR